MEEKDCYSGSLLVSFLLGSLVGAGIALLIAPQTGRETRGKIREYTESAKEKAAESVQKVKSVLEEKTSVLSAA
ncbi:MAG: YtxH domain-containing protein, partial [Proteobacteria bacterium]|nr:YtxH domain-containing protein [Pseudomonadota bacterium]MBU1570829.1 YtxH domain-containing protein [Pseudomonadota bacterium]